MTAWWQVEDDVAQSVRRVCTVVRALLYGTIRYSTMDKMKNVK